MFPVCPLLLANVVVIESICADARGAQRMRAEKKERGLMRGNFPREENDQL